MYPHFSKILSALVIVTVSVLVLVSCDQSSDDKQNAAQEASLNQAVNAIGMPAITEFAEKKLLKEIYELRDKMIPTTTYIVDLNGHLHKLCNSMGYGIPYATQYTAPSRLRGGGTILVPNADPNGLFSPSSADGTWVACINPETKQAAVMYIEPRVVVSPFPLSVD